MEERRNSHRYNLPLSVTVRPLPQDSASEFRVTTRDVSTGGLYFTSTQRLNIGNKLDLAVTLPSEATAGSSITIDAQAHVLRVDDTPGGPLGIAFSLFVVGIASMSLILDFDIIESGAREGLGKYMEWYGAFALMVTLIWLYMEILRLLSKINRRD